MKTARQMPTIDDSVCSRTVSAARVAPPRRKGNVLVRLHEGCASPDLDERRPKLSGSVDTEVPHAAAALLRFSRGVSCARVPADVCRLLAEVGTAGLAGRSAAVLVAQPDGTLTCAAFRGVSPAHWFNPSAGGENEIPAPGRPLAARISGPDGEFYGLIAVDAGDAHRCWSADDRDLLLALADRTAVAFGRIARLEALRRSETALSSARTALERTQGLAMLGEMAAGIVHDLRNVLSPLSLHLQFLRRQLRTTDMIALESVEEMQSIVRRGTEVTERLRLFSKQGANTQGAVSTDINEVARRALVVGRPYACSRRVAIRLHEHLGATAPVRIAPADGVAVIANLIINAIDAVSDGGNVTISTETADSETLISVADDGIGMTAEVKSHMFEPFFTTKGESGTGLGLSMAYAFARRHSAELRVDSAPGQGTTMTLAFPHDTETTIET